MKAKDREMVFNKYGGRCAYCGCELQKGWHVDHLEPLHRDSKYDRGKRKLVYAGTCRRPQNEFADNYNPSCASCNNYKHSMSLETFREQVGLLVGRLNKSFTQYKIAKRYGLVQETIKPVVFYFETFK